MLLRRYFDVLDEIVDHIAEIGACLHVLFDLLHGVDGGGVISAELLPYLLVRKIGHLAHHIHRHLSGLGNLRGALGRFDILGGHFKGAGDF